MEVRDLGKKLVALVAAICLAVACFGLAACGGGTPASSSSASASASASESSSNASSSSFAANPADKFVGSWTFAAAESQGVTMSGNFGALFDMGDSGMLTIKTDGSGTMNFGGETAEFSWAESGSDAIDVTVIGDTKITIAQTTPITYKDDALFMDIEQDGQAAIAIFTKDGVYAGAKDFALSDAKPISSEANLLGTWKLVGMKMMGIAVYGTSDSLSSMNGGVDQSLTFEAGGVVKIGDTMQGTWAMDANGATITSEDITGVHTYPVLMLDGMLVADMTEIMQGQEFATIYEK
ncbi:MAG: hypothetical protein IJ087_19920 [Eggerthellaceae bacterium]|nr:hypothetical protein [Eggerthellaceae bacterium]